MSMNFNVEQINLICIYQGETRKRTIANLEAMRHDLGPEETELDDLARQTIAALRGITDVDYAALDLIPAFDEG